MPALSIHCQGYWLRSWELRESLCVQAPRLVKGLLEDNKKSTKSVHVVWFLRSCHFRVTAKAHKSQRVCSNGGEIHRTAPTLPRVKHKGLGFSVRMTLNYVFSLHALNPVTSQTSANKNEKLLVTYLTLQQCYSCVVVRLLRLTDWLL